MRRPSCPASPLVAICLALASCTGGPARKAPPAVAAVAAPVERLPPPSAACAGPPRAGRTGLRMLTNREYERTVMDLLGVPAGFAEELPERLTKVGFDNDVSLVPTSISATGISSFARAARRAADLAVARQEKLLPAGCRPHAGDEPCLQRFLDGFLPRAFRAPPTAEQRDRLLSIYRTVRRQQPWDEAFGAVLEAALQMPELLYFREGLRRAAPGQAVPLSPHEIAARLSYFLVGTLPDARLRAAAESGALRTVAGREAEARRLLATPAARESFRTFYRQWLELDELEGLSRPRDLFPRFEDGVRDALREETERFVDDLAWETPRDVAELLTSPVAFVNGPLAAYYGVPAPSGDPKAWGRVTLDPAQRPGVLTRAAWTAAHAHADQTSPILRGVAVRARIMCQPPPPPPPTIVSVPPKITRAMTTRARFDDHRESGVCSRCHALIDGIGFGFETYDAAGGWRTTEGDGLPVDASGEVVSATDTALDGKFQGAAELMRRLANSDQFRGCVERQVLRYAIARFEDDADACSLEQLRARVGRRYTLQDLLAAVVQTDAFLHVDAPVRVAPSRP